MTFTDKLTFISMQLLSIFYIMLHFVGSKINTHDDDDEIEWQCQNYCEWKLLLLTIDAQ